MAVHAIQSAENALRASKFIEYFGNFFDLFLNFDCIILQTNRGNTEGWRCHECKAGYFGNPAKGCELCRCQGIGSENNECDSETGKCKCQRMCNNNTNLFIKNIYLEMAVNYLSNFSQ